MSAHLRLLCLGAVGVLAVLLGRPVALLVLVGLSAAAFLASPATRSWWRAAALGSGVLVWSTVVSQGLFYADWPRTPLLVLGPVVVTSEGVVHGAVQSLRLLAVSLAGMTVAAGTSPDRLMMGLVRLKVPWALSFLAVTSLRLVPVVSGEWLIVRQARVDRGPMPTSPLGRLKTELDLLRPVVARTLRRSRALAMSLDARGFDPVAPRTLPQERSNGLSRVAGGTLLGATLLVVLIRVLEGLYLAGLLYLPSIRWIYGAARAWL